MAFGELPHCLPDDNFRIDSKGPNGWVLPQADDYACQANKIQPLLEKLVALKANRLVTQTSSSHKQLKVADQDFERSIEFQLPPTPAPAPTPTRSP